MASTAAAAARAVQVMAAAAEEIAAAKAVKAMAAVVGEVPRVALRTRRR